MESYRHLDEEGLIDRTCSIVSTELSSEGLSMKIENAKALLAYLRHKQADAEAHNSFDKTLEGVIIACKLLNAPVLACRSQNVKNEYCVAQKLLSNAKTDAELKEASKHISDISFYIRNEKEKLEEFSQIIQDIQARVEKLPDGLRKNHKIDEKPS